MKFSVVLAENAESNLDTYTLRARCPYISLLEYRIRIYLLIPYYNYFLDNCIE